MPRQDHHEPRRRGWISCPSGSHHVSACEEYVVATVGRYGKEKAEREVVGMVKVSIKVRSGAYRFCVAVQAESIQRAVSLVAGRYPGGDYGVKFPIDPEGFFVKEPADRAGIVNLERPGVLAG
jgi:hypothetical protein